MQNSFLIWLTIISPLKKIDFLSVIFFQQFLLCFMLSRVVVLRKSGRYFQRFGRFKEEVRHPAFWLFRGGGWDGGEGKTSSVLVAEARAS